MKRPAGTGHRSSSPTTWKTVTLMDRSNVSRVLCAGQIKKWRGAIVGYDIRKLRAKLKASRDHVFQAAGVACDMFRP